MNRLAFTMLLCFATVVSAGPIDRVALPVEVRELASIPKELEGKQWNRWTSENFVVCSLNDTQAQYLNQHLEHIKTWALTRWGMPDVKFSAECKLICVDDPALFAKLFPGLTGTRVEVRRDVNGRIKESVIFLLVNDSPSHIIPSPLTEVCLAEFGQAHNLRPGLWAARGVAGLNASLDQVRRNLGDLGGADFTAREILEMDEIQYRKLPPERQAVYDRKATALCLLLRKEFGQRKFLSFFDLSAKGSPEIAVQTALGFSDYGHFDRTFGRYLVDLSRDLTSNKTPDSYLQIRER